MSRNAIQANARLGIFEPHQPLAIFLDQPLFALRDVIGRHARPVAHGLGQQVLGAQEIQPGRARRQFLGGEIAPIAQRLAARHLLGPVGLEKPQPVFGVGQFDFHLCHVRVLQQVGAEFR